MYVSLHTAARRRDRRRPCRCMLAAKQTEDEDITLNVAYNMDCMAYMQSLPDGAFALAVVDPPYGIDKVFAATSRIAKYGQLDENWPRMLRDGFQECMRVLKPDGVLIFKWSEYDIPAAHVWKAIGQKPLFGHHSGKQSRTFWACFMKMEELEMLEGME